MLAHQCKSLAVRRFQCIAWDLLSGLWGHLDHTYSGEELWFLSHHFWQHLGSHHTSCQPHCCPPHSTNATTKGPDNIFEIFPFPLERSQQDVIYTANPISNNCLMNQEHLHIHLIQVCNQPGLVFDLMQNQCCHDTLLWLVLQHLPKTGHSPALHRFPLATLLLLDKFLLEGQFGLNTHLLQNKYCAEMQSHVFQSQRILEGVSSRTQHSERPQTMTTILLDQDKWLWHHVGSCQS
mmetsp:Transcript_6969/g.12922  ORF Transcript_6969/g.12922 Transcript_6969/m.12922 type:complete len:236 (-) Transcript_6969:737-1444(-)